MDKKIIENLEALSLDEIELKKSINYFKNICSKKEEELDFKTIKSLLEPIIELLKKWNTIKDQSIISTALQGISSLVTDEIDDEGIAPYFVKIGLISIILEILDKSTDSLPTYAELNSSSLKCIGDLILNSDYLVNKLVINGFLSIVSKLLLKSTQSETIRDCYWAISNILASTDDYKLLQKVIDSGIIGNLVKQQLDSPPPPPPPPHQNLQYKINNKIITDMYWCVSNSLISANNEQFKFFISHYRYLEYLQCVKNNLKEETLKYYYEAINEIIVKTLQLCQEEHSLTFYKKFIADSFIISILKENDKNNLLINQVFSIIEDNLTSLNNFVENFK
ncbi:hypothetical protein ACTFIZ_009624 [Dictyostelium cf. discoideum]